MTVRQWESMGRIPDSNHNQNFGRLSWKLTVFCTLMLIQPNDLKYSDSFFIRKRNDVSTIANKVFFFVILSKISFCLFSFFEISVKNEVFKFWTITRNRREIKNLFQILWTYMVFHLNVEHLHCSSFYSFGWIKIHKDRFFFPVNNLFSVHQIKRCYK